MLSLLHRVPRREASSAWVHSYSGGMEGPKVLALGAVESLMNIIDTPSGRFIFVGRGIPAALAYVSKDGGPATSDQLENAAKFGPRLAGVKSRSFASREEAEAAQEAEACNPALFGGEQAHPIGGCTCRACLAAEAKVPRTTHR